MIHASARSRYRALLPVVFALAWPTMLEELMQTAVQYIDTAMVGRLGTDATAAVGSTTTVNWLVGSSIYAFGIGFLAAISQALGAKDGERARRVSAQSVLAVLVTGGFFTVLTVGLSDFVPAWMQVEPGLQPLAARYFRILYMPMLARTATTIFGTVLRAAGDTKTPMRIGLVVNLINVILNFFLIYPTRTISVFGLRMTVWGAGLGVTGAAIATAIAYVLGGTAMFLCVYRNPVLGLRGQKLRLDREIMRDCVRIGSPIAAAHAGSHLGQVVFTALIARLGTIAIAAHSIAITAEQAFYVPGYGMQAAAATLTGNSLGAGDEKRRRDLARLIVLLEVGLMLLSGALLFAFAPTMAGIFSKDPEVIALGSTVLRMVACSEPFYGVSIAVEGMLQGAGKTRVPFVINIAGMWGVRILGTWICTTQLGMGLVSAWACMIGHNLLLFALFLVYYLRGSWNPLKST